MKRESVLFGTAILIVTNTAVKLMSLVYRGALIRVIGAEGLGLTELMAPFYSLLLVIASLGVPLAISNRISAEGDGDGSGDIVRTGTILLAVTGLIVIVATLVFFPLLKEIVFSDERVVPAFFLLIPSIGVISVFSALRGFFQGSRLVSYLGKSQVVEQLLRIIIGIGFVVALRDAGYSLPIILIGFAVASLIAEIGGGLYLYGRYHKLRRRRGRFRPQVARQMLQMGLPITMSRLILTAIPAIQAVLIPGAMIAHGATASAAASFYGLFIGVAVTVLHLPSVVTGALTTPLIPAVAAADARGRTSLRNARIEKSLAFTYMATVPILLLLFYDAEAVCRLLFASPEAGPLLSFLCFGAIFIYMQQPVIAILQGMNRFSRIFVHYGLTGIFYIAALWLLGRSDAFSIRNVLILFLADDLLLFLLNYVYLKRITGFHVPFCRFYLAPLCAAALSFVAMVCIEKEITRFFAVDILSLTVPACSFLIIYVLFLYLWGIVGKAAFTSFLSPQRRR